jgi:PAS domain-containing protein
LAEPTVAVKNTVDEGLVPWAVAHEALGFVTWIWNPDAATLEWSADLSPQLGLPTGTFAHTFTAFVQHLHPDDREPSVRRLRACLKGDLPRYRAEERVIWPDGSVHWLVTYGRGSYGPDGRALHLAGVVRDITEHQRAIEERLASEHRFRQVIEHAPLAMGISRDQTIVYVNDSFARLFGCASPQAAVGRPVLDLVQPEAREAFVRAPRRPCTMNCRCCASMAPPSPALCRWQTSNSTTGLPRWCFCKTIQSAPAITLQCRWNAIVRASSWTSPRPCWWGWTRPAM